MIKNTDYIIRTIDQPTGRTETFKNYVRDAFNELDMRKLNECNDFDIAMVYGEVRAVPKPEICIKCRDRWNEGDDKALCPECHEIESKKEWSKWLN